VQQIIPTIKLIRGDCGELRNSTGDSTDTSEIGRAFFSPNSLARRDPGYGGLADIEREREQLAG
jgi:hypothetical protein